MLNEFRNLKPLEMKVVYFVYAIIAFICMIWDGFFRGSPLAAWENSAPVIPWWWLGVFCLALSYWIVTIITRWLFEWSRKLDALLIQLLTPISYLQILWLSLASGFVEEWFFRGVLLNHLGLWLSSILFGLSHLILSRRLWIWSLWTFFAGALFGLIYQQTNSLLLVSVLHSVINAGSLIILNRRSFRVA